PAQSLSAVRSLPVPPHRVHGTLKRIFPAACCTVPVPPQTAHVCGEPTAPVPWHVSQASSLVMESFFTAPRTASQKSISIWYSRWRPGIPDRDCFLARRARRKKWLKRSQKLHPPPAASHPPPKSNPSKSNLTSGSPLAPPAPP